MLSGWELFRIHQALKLHFTSESYDVVKYSGKTRATFDSFQRRDDRFKYDAVANKLFGKNKAGHFCIANIMYGSQFFIYDQFADSYDVYLKWKKVRESITREFENDVSYLNQLAGSRPNLDLYAKTKSGKMPPLLQVALAGHIHVESLVILNNEHREFFDKWSELCHTDPMLSGTILKWKKYTPFVAYDVDRIKPIIEGALF